MPTPVRAAYCRVTVLAPGRRVDVALPADVPLAEVVPLVLELLGAPRPSGRVAAWRFTGATGGVLPAEATLDDLGVLDGELLRFGPAVPPPPPPVFDDPVDALAGLAGRGDTGGGSAPVVVAVLALAAAALVAAASTGAGRVAAALGLAGALLALARAAQVARRPATGDGPDRRTALVPACCAVPLAAATGWVALPSPAGAAPLLLAVVAAGLAAAVGQVAVRAVAPPLIAAVVVAVAVAAGATVGLRFGVPPAAAAAITAAVALAAGPLLPRVVLRLAGLPRPVVAGDAAGLVAADDGPDLLPVPELAERAHVARGQLAGLSGGCAVTAAAAAPLATTGPPGWSAPTLAGVVAAVLLLRARSFADRGTARVHLAAGTAAALGSVGLAAAAAGAAGRLGAGSALLAAAAAVTIAADRRSHASPVVRPAHNNTDRVQTAAALPLALAAAGVLAIARGL